MARNVGLQILRGLKVNIPTLLLGETYFTTDTGELYIGSSSGNRPITIPVYNASGTKLTSPHMVVDRVVIPSGGSATVTLSATAAFTSSTSYVCVVTDNIVKRTLNVVQNSGTSFTVSGGGTGDVVSYVCIGV